MKKFKQASVLFILIIVIIFTANQYVFAAKDEISVKDFIRKVEYSDDFKKWTELSEAEKTGIIQPKFYDELNTNFVATNPYYQVNLLNASLNNRFSLKDVIGSNVIIKNQYNTSACWAFSGLSSLETNLALNNYTLGKNTNKIYDFSERHLNYVTTRKFANNGINSFGFNRTPEIGGQWILVESYLTNGQGAVNETDMPFENNSNLINLSEIQNKDIQTRVYDTVYFDNYNELTGTDKTNEMNKIKQHIQNYGSVFASIHGDSSDVESYNCYNNDTGAKYCNNSLDHPIDHAISIIGWDDEYSIDNFAENMKPTNKGAWIVRNSWGKELEYDVLELKSYVFSKFEEDCIAAGWNKAEDISNEFIENALNCKIENGKVKIPIGDNGYMYVSYEDCNVGETLYGITKALDTVDYDYLYQYNELYPAVALDLTINKAFLCNIFDKKSDAPEYLTGVALTAPETYTCKVYVNPNGTSKAKEDMKQVQLLAGESETIAQGYHTLEFAKPFKITGEQYTVVVEIEGTRNNLNVLIEGKIQESDLFDYVKTETGKCFISSSTDFDSCYWFDLGTLEDSLSTLTNGDSSIKAFTISEYEDITLEKIEIVNGPNKVDYNEGEDFIKEGLVLRAVYSDGSTKILDEEDYSISNGTNLQPSQKSVVIKYMDKTVEQKINVSEITKDYNDVIKEEESAKSSDFSKAICKLLNIKAYYYTSDSSKNYTLVDTQISNMTKASDNDSYEYYYYLSPKSNLTSISNWVKISDQAKTDSNLRFTVDSRDIPNISEVSKATTLYIYIKEVVTNGGNQSVVVSKALKYEQGSVAIEKYVDGALAINDNTSNEKKSDVDNSSKENGSTGGTQSQMQNPTQEQNSKVIQGQTSLSTTSPTKLPNTGSSLLLVVIVVIAILGLIIFVRYEILNREVK